MTLSQFQQTDLEFHLFRYVMRKTNVDRRPINAIYSHPAGLLDESKTNLTVQFEMELVCQFLERIAEICLTVQRIKSFLARLRTGQDGEYQDY